MLNGWGLVKMEMNIHKSNVKINNLEILKTLNNID